MPIQVGTGSLGFRRFGLSEFLDNQAMNGNRTRDLPVFYRSAATNCATAYCNVIPTNVRAMCKIYCKLSVNMRCSTCFGICSPTFGDYDKKNYV
jgi:hypothetical protein